eukprot:CAMPEP_0204257054 /NCGR_PEP_ID=MMETSP0468-20130131/4163_1 /ASSEMBLY_ACC=CAM_ASM_000383 /TAXON_ID=2969 /ORGANISM="Oxyrrhis marina" /LENGTH=578 /DNA_ID=CAMNT_0051231101 /DNA_START=22 /DNA_END=1758 /DNA_ORIENTATION=-
MMSGPRRSGDPRVEDFIELNGLDDVCAGALRRLDKLKQDVVMDMPPVGFHITEVDASRGTPSSVVMGRMKKARSMRPAELQQAGAPTRENVAARIDAFMKLNSLDERCLDALSNMHPEISAQVMDTDFILKNVDPAKGSPSSLVMSKIKKVRSRAPMPAMAPMGVPAAHGFAPVHHAAPMRPRAPAPITYHVGASNFAQVGYVADTNGSDEGFGAGPLAPREFWGSPDRVEDFIELNGLDEKCANSLRQLSPVEVNWVMDQGPFIFERVDANKGNPSALAMARLRKLNAMSESEKSQYPSAASVRFRCEEFIRINGLDDRCAGILRTMDPASVQAVLDSGFLLRNIDASKGTASTLIMARLKRIRMSGGVPVPQRRERSRSRPRGRPPPPMQMASFVPRPAMHHVAPQGKGGGKGSPKISRLDGFIEVNRLDARCADRLRGLDPALQEMVMDEGFVLKNIRPDKGSESSLIMGRIKKVQSTGVPPGYPDDETLQSRLEGFIEVNGLDDRCVSALHQLSRDQQQAIMSKCYVIAHVDPSRGSASGMIMKQCRRLMGGSDFGGGGSTQYGGALFTGGDAS